MRSGKIKTQRKSIGRRRIGLRCITLLPILIGSVSLLLRVGVRLLRRDHDEPQVPSTSGGNAKLSALSSVKSISVSSLPKPKQTESRLQRLTSVDYMSCCGLGHRLTKMSDAHFVARQLNLALRSFWGYCDETEVFHYLFGPQPSEELIGVADSDRYLRLNNDVPGFRVLTRRGSTAGNKTSCPCSLEKMREDVRFYLSLRNRFRFSHKVQAFRETHFGGNRTVVGLHIRAGNGETGDFQTKGRAIAEVNVWLRELSRRLLSKNDWRGSVLFVATDTPRMIGALQTMLGSHMAVVSLDQARPEDGEGVLFGERSKVLDRGGSACLSGWIDSLSDMILLSHCDAVVAARPSSFTQSMPLSLVLGDAGASKPSSPSSASEFCEVNRDATEMRCYRSLQDWCCNGTTSFSLEGIQGHDYLSVPRPDFESGRYQLLDREDPRCTPRPRGKKQVCLPYDWSEFPLRSWQS